ncbi:MAG: cytochrome c family protein [Planctomycetes bacterium]|nr:cytochrome c family protein [Planctomycetota bacterium]
MIAATGCNQPTLAADGPTGSIDDPAAPGTSLETPVAPTEGDQGFSYLGTKKCRMCHTRQYASWLDSPKADSWQALAPGAGAAVKRRAGLDPGLDYRQDERCLPCHTVGYGQPGGYAIPAPGDDGARRKASARQGAGCEACHGPGSGFVQVMQDIHRKRRSYDPAEVRAAGRHPVTREVCRRCHNQSAICMTGPDGNVADEHAPWLNVDISDRHGFHEKVPFKYRRSTPTAGASADQPPEKSDASSPLAPDRSPRTAAPPAPGADGR